MSRRPLSRLKGCQSSASSRAAVFGCDETHFCGREKYPTPLLPFGYNIKAIQVISRQPASFKGQFGGIYVAEA